MNILRFIIAAAVAIGAYVLYEQRSTLRNRSAFPPAGTVRFPEVTGTNLSRKPYSLPGDFEGRMNILMIAFKQRQQLDINTWVPTVQRLAAEHSDVRYYELPVIERANPMFRSFVDNGMRSGIRDQTARDTTITLYIDKTAFRGALELPDEDRIYVMLVDRDGSILWRTEGSFSEDAERELEAIITQ